MVTCAALRYGRDAKSTPAKPLRSVLAAKTLEQFSDDPGGGAYHSCLSGGVTDPQSVAGVVQRDARLPLIKSPVKAETGETAVEKGRGLATGRLFERFKGNNEALYLKHDRCGNN